MLRAGWWCMVLVAAMALLLGARQATAAGLPFALAECAGESCLSVDDAPPAGEPDAPRDFGADGDGSDGESESEGDGDTPERLTGDPWSSDVPPAPGARHVAKAAERRFCDAEPGELYRPPRA